MKTREYRLFKNEKEIGTLKAKEVAFVTKVSKATIYANVKKGNGIAVFTRDAIQYKVVEIEQPQEKAMESDSYAKEWELNERKKHQKKEKQEHTKETGWVIIRIPNSWKRKANGRLS